MENPRERSYEDIGYLSLGDDEHAEELQDEKPAVASVIEAGGDDEKKMPSEPEQGAAGGEEGHVGTGACGPVDDDQKGGGGDQEPQEEPACEATEDPQARDKQHRYQSTFSPLQLQELENIFQRSQYPDVFAGKELAIHASVTEAKVQVSKPEKEDVAE